MESAQELQANDERAHLFPKNGARTDAMIKLTKETELSGSINTMNKSSGDGLKRSEKRDLEIFAGPYTSGAHELNGSQSAGQPIDAPTSPVVQSLGVQAHSPQTGLEDKPVSRHHEQLDKLQKDFMQLLRDNKWFNIKLSWTVTQDALKWDQRYMDVGDDALSEKWFNEFRQNLIRQDFFELLRDTPWVHSRSSWQVTKEAIKGEERYMAVGDDKLSVEWFNQFTQDRKRQDFMELLSEIPDIHCGTTWRFTQDYLTGDPRFLAVGDDALSKKWFEEFMKKRQDFMQLLRDKPGIRSRSRWQVTKDCLKGDPRFLAVGNDALLKKWFNEYIKTLKPCNIDVVGFTSIKFWICLLVLSPLKWYRCTLWISIPHIIGFAFHLAKLVVTTCAVLHFGGCRKQFSDVITHGQLVLKHNLLKGWSADYETLTYPPPLDPFAVYNVEDFIDRINFAVEGYYNIEFQATGHFTILPVDQVHINLNYMLTDSITEIRSSTLLPNYGLTNVTENGHIVYKYDVLKELEYYNLSGVFNSILDVNLTASLHSFRVPRKGAAMCLQIQINVEYNDIDFDGEVDIELQTLTTTVACQRMNITAADAAICEENANKHFIWLTIVTCVFDSLSCLIAIGLIIIVIIIRYSKENVNKICPYFLRWWSLVSLIGDSFIFFGKTLLDNENNKRNDQKLRSFDKIAFFYGIGCLLCWIGFMRHLKINRKFSLLFHTIYHARSNILAFMACTGILFAGYWACAFVTLGVYHPKFETKSRVAVSLSALMFADDFFGTVASVHYENAGSEDWLIASVIIVIYSFVFLFTLLALNLLIALTNSSYNTINEIEKKEESTTMSLETDSMFIFLNGEENQYGPDGFGICVWLFCRRYYSRFTCPKCLQT
ncbi:mucolipin-2-like isoform X2 [Dreissena polymorpha]|uniref:mucolipin-2-like isoform X2 n=1 Tax=Dreissena polymorpha TaxID=45954 RepID=UPI00226411DD|nr:mucolipin-2-like isoform X2 [Dreissena polymorpha]